MDKNEVLLDSYALQKDMRIRLPKQVLSNLPVTVGSIFDVFYNPVTQDIILRVSKTTESTERYYYTEDKNR